MKKILKYRYLIVIFYIALFIGSVIFTIENKNLYHHVGIYSYTPDSINTFINLPKSKNEIDLSLEQMRAMDSNIPIGVTYVPEVPMSVDTKEDLINIETNIREQND